MFVTDPDDAPSEPREVSNEKPSGSRLPEDRDDTLETIRRYIAEKLGFYSDDTTDKSEKPKVIKHFWSRYSS